MTGNPPFPHPSSRRLSHTRGADDALVALGRIPLWSTPTSEVLQQVVMLARAAIPAADAVSITVLDSAGASTAASTGPLAADLDRQQYARDAGPCLDAARGGMAVTILDTDTEAEAEAEHDYPHFAASVRRAGVRSVLSVGAPIRDRIAGSLNLYSSREAPFDAESADLAATFTRYAVAVADAGLGGSAQELTEQMQAAASHRPVIEQAKGVVMFRTGCDPDTAFALLVAQSQQANRKLHDIATELVESTQERGARWTLLTP